MKSWELINYELSEPFNAYTVEFRAGAVSYDKKSAMALAYVDPREYQFRLDEVVGSGYWNVQYRQIGDAGIVCTLQITGTDDNGNPIQAMREEVGEFEANDRSRWPNASSQSFKRACSSFGLGRYLYGLKQKYFPIKEMGENTYNPRFLDVEQIRSELLGGQHITPENRRRTEERVIQLMSQTYNQEKFIMPSVAITEMNYDELVQYGKHCKSLISTETSGK
jgi:hypothetical protein